MIATQMEIHRGDNTLLGRIGNTPLLRLERITRELGKPNLELFAKAEWFNPGGSVKDRPVLSMILEGERTGQLTREKTIIDATSGNTGIAYAMIGATLNYRVRVALPRNASDERKRIIHAYGAEILLTDPMEGTDGAQRLVRRIVEQHPEEFFFPDQYNNPKNWQAHYLTTAAEIIDQTQGRVTHFVAGLGTTGTFVGTSRRLREFNPAIQAISFQPDSPLHGMEGLKHLPSAMIPGIYDEKLADASLEVSTEEAYRMVRLLARQEGLLVGVSSGAALAASLRITRSIDKGVIVTVFPDDGWKYLSESFWSDPA